MASQIIAGGIQSIATQVLSSATPLININKIPFKKQTLSIDDHLRNLGITPKNVGQAKYDLIRAQAEQNGLDYVAKEYASTSINNTMDEIEAERDGSGAIGELLFLDPNGNVIDIQGKVGSQLNYVDPYQLGYSTGTLLGYLNNNVSHDPDYKFESPAHELLYNMLKSMKNTPENAFVADKLNAYLKNTTFYNNQTSLQNQYEQIFAIYDGQFQSNPYVDENGNFAIIDETGVKRVYTGSKGITILGKNIRTPTLHGTWVGPASPNDTLPVDLLDTYAMLHDIEYEEGYFNKLADWKLVSRIEHNLHKMKGMQYYKAKFTAHWFKNSGALLQGVVGQEYSASETDRVVSLEYNDFYSYLLPTKQFPTTDPRAGVISKAKRLIRTQGRDYFNAGLNAGFQESMLDISRFEGIPENSYGMESNSYLVDVFDNIRVISTNCHIQRVPPKVPIAPTMEDVPLSIVEPLDNTQ